jgi:hyperosmotically inducible protein
MGATRFKQVLAAGLIGVACVTLNARSAAAARQTTEAAAAPAVDDDALQAHIETALEKSPSLAARHIDVDVDHGVVTLTGAVRTAAEKTRAGRLAAVKGVTRVDNQITVDPKIDQPKLDAAGEKTKAGLGKAFDATVTAAKKTKTVVQKGAGKTEQGVAKAADKTSDAIGTAGDKVSDTSLTTRVKAAFSEDKVLQGTAIDVSTTDGVVTLKGSLSSEDLKARAAVRAEDVKGVVRVVNQIVVEK